MNEKFTRQNILDTLEAAADNLMWLRESIKQGKDFGFDLDVATCYAKHELKPIMEYLESISDRPLLS